MHYFNGRGRAEISRLIFAASNTVYDDHRIAFDTEWPNQKKNAPLNQLPYLEMGDGNLLAQSIAIARFIAKETNLAGKNNLEQVN